MSEETTHDLHDFMQQKSKWMAEEYDRIQKRATEDPGTAGDQGEENWAKLLRDWLPRTYEVVTKGRIISQDGRTSPQIDVLVLKSIYPKQLVDENQKMYLAAGVAAAFECKTTLKAAHIDEAIETCVKIKNLYPAREGTPYKELHAPIVYGLLAHSHSWKGPNSTPANNIAQKLLKFSGASYLSHPRQGLDLLCVADLGTWFSGHITFIRPQPAVKPSDSLYRLGGSTDRICVAHTTLQNKQVKHFTPIGVLIYCLSQKLAWENPELRDLADYYRNTDVVGSGITMGQPTAVWPSSTIYSRAVYSRLLADKSLPRGYGTWDEWAGIFL